MAKQSFKNQSGSVRSRFHYTKRVTSVMTRLHTMAVTSATTYLETGVSPLEGDATMTPEAKYGTSCRPITSSFC